MTDHLIHDRAAIRDAWDDDRERITRRVAAAQTAGSLPAVVEIVLDERAAALAAKPAHDVEIARRLEWATGRNGATLLAQIRTEGLDVMSVRTEDPQ